MTVSIVIEQREGTLEGDLVVPSEPKGVVVFAHGSGSSRHSPRNLAVASSLSEAGFATLLMDLLTNEEERREQAGGMLRFDIELLADRLQVAASEIGNRTETANLSLGFFGASTGGGAALVAAAQMQNVSAVVSRGGRPDLADEWLRRVTAPTLLIVGERDPSVIQMNRNAMEKMKGDLASLEIVPGATHLFEEPGALEEVARLARGWFQLYLSDG